MDKIGTSSEYWDQSKYNLNRDDYLKYIDILKAEQKLIMEAI